MVFEYSKTVFVLLLVSVIFLSVCKEDDTSAIERETALNNLAGNNSKSWKTYSLYIDEDPRMLTKCDSAHILILSRDFTWEEFYDSFKCAGYYDGTWSLNDENNVLEISYFDPYQWKSVQQKFEIIELNDKTFTYRIVISNLFKTVKLVPYPG